MYTPGIGWNVIPKENKVTMERNSEREVSEEVHLKYCILWKVLYIKASQAEFLMKRDGSTKKIEGVIWSKSQNKNRIW